MTHWSIAVPVCLVLMAAPNTAEAQSKVSFTIVRDLAKVCGSTATWTRCLKAGLAKGADVVLAELQAPSAPAPGAQGRAAGSSSQRIVWDGTFAHPYAPNFYALKSYVRPDTRTSEEACAQLPEALRTNRQLLLTMTCHAQRELMAAGADMWTKEREELRNLRRILTSCLPTTAPNQDPCSVP